MIRGIDITFDPSIRYPGLPEEGSEWKASIRYLDSWGFALNSFSKGALLANKMGLLSTPISEVTGPLGRIAQVANLAISAESISILAQQGVLQADLPSVKEVLGLAGKGVEVSVWLAKIERLGISFRLINSLSSMGLVLAFLYPMLTLLIQLRDEGWNAFSGVECYKTSYKIGMALLAIYLFTTAVTVSTYLEVVMLGTNFALSYL